MVFKRNSLSAKIKKIVVEKNIVSAKDMDEAIKRHKQGQGHLIKVLMDMELITKKDFLTKICSDLGYELVDLPKTEISSETLSKIPKNIAKQYIVMPIEFKENRLKVALTDPMNIFLLDDLKTVTKCEIVPCVASEEDITNAIAEKYEGISHESIERMVEGIDEQEEIDILSEQEEEVESKADLLRLTQDAPVVKLTNLLIAEGIKLRASDILIEPREDSVRIRYRVDGLLVEGKSAPKRVHSAIVSRLKVMSDLNIAERRLPQDGRFKLKMHNREIDFRISILPSNIGEKVALRVLDRAQVTLDIDKLGFKGKSLEDMKKASERPHGMILVCGPTGCGKTTTLYSMLKSIDDPQKNIITVEDPVEYQIFGINQVSVKPELGLTFGSSLRSILRQDPDIVMIGEIRDFETVDIAIKAALTGHLVISTLHTTTASGSIVRLVNMGVEPFLITSSLLLVCAQRLIRQLCPRCKQEYMPPKNIIETLGISKKAVLFKPKGCSFCDNLGYKGRTGITEVLVLTSEIRTLILERAQEHEITKMAKEQGMQSLRDNAIVKLLEGETSVEEVIRLTM